jgi:hypothetical protein
LISIWKTKLQKPNGPPCNMIVDDYKVIHVQTNRILCQLIMLSCRCIVVQDLSTIFSL